MLLSVGEVVSSVEKWYHLAELSHLILPSLAKVTYLRMDAYVLFLELCLGDPFGMQGTQNGTWGVTTLWLPVAY
jgi:hypothetical protein